MTTLKLATGEFACAAALMAALSLLPVIGRAQSATTPTASQQTKTPAELAAEARGEEEAIRLKEFVVTDSQDLGYSTTNAIGVTRTNTALIDTPTTINVINRQFMEDFQVGELFDALKYVAAVTIESNVGDSTMICGYRS